VPIVDPMPVLTETELATRLERLTESGVRLLAGSVVDMAGVARAKTVPMRRAGDFHTAGMGASPTWNVFCVDNAIAFTERLGVIGDLRLRVDLAAARVLGDGWAWAPAEMFDQAGAPSPNCARGRLRRIQARAEAEGLTVLTGHELEFVLTDADGAPLSERRWQAYGLGSVMREGEFLADLSRALEGARLRVEQLHAEFGTGQFELSLGPAEPVRAADDACLARLVIGRVAAAHGMTPSFSPLPFHDGAGNGAHVHLSLARDGRPLLSGGAGPHGLTDEGAAAVAGIVAGLPDTVGVLSGSLLSPARLAPGHWSGAFACWGLENREAAVRLLADTPGNPHGASVEVKCGDPSANVYLASALILGLALNGIERSTPLPAEVRVNPADDPSAVRLPATQAQVLDALAGSAAARAILGEDILDALLAVRRHELDAYGDVGTAVLAERFRFAWTS
jgi:glutamine synthetase